ncbi:MAG: hypothetical protein QXV35_06965 [Archaeoglobaceae archaeon]
MSAKLLLIPVILLGIAVTYSQFGETLYIGSENDPNVVQTANLEWSLIKKKSSCFEKAPAEPYASISCEWIDVPNGETKVIATVVNAYPSYTFGIHFCINNTGILPSKLKDLVVEVDEALANNAKVNFSMRYSLDGSNNPIVYRSAHDLSFSEFESKVEELLAGKVFSTNGYLCFGEDDESQTIWIWFPRDSNPPQGETLRFNITFVFTQFNS